MTDYTDPERHLKITIRESYYDPDLRLAQIDNIIRWGNRFINISFCRYTYDYQMQEDHMIIELKGLSPRTISHSIKPSEDVCIALLKIIMQYTHPSHHDELRETIREYESDFYILSESERRRFLRFLEEIHPEEEEEEEGESVKKKLNRIQEFSMEIEERLIQIRELSAEISEMID